jgi:bifunctional N-acetylglucosamine-1-phosphate-uridyltransferase/glucosamine-1-phosphate-acetyltransferase GlmU-like protein
MQAQPVLDGFLGDIVVTCGDAPLLTTQTLALLVEKRRATGAAASLLIGDIASPGSYGRVICDRDGTVSRIVEARDASPEVRALHTVNAGTYCFWSADLWEQLAKINSDNQAGELYLTDVVGLLTAAGRSVTGIIIGDREMTGVNTRADLAALEAELAGEESRQDERTGTGVNQ